MDSEAAKYLYAFSFLLSLGGSSLTSTDLSDPRYQIVNRMFKECVENSGFYSCLAGKAAKAVDGAVNVDLPLFDGFVLKRNEEVIDNLTEPRSSSGLDHLSTAVSRFLDAHTLTLDLSESRGDSGDSGAFGYGKVGRKEKKYLYYAMMAVLGIFGLSGPLILKALALVAGKALLASKAALIIVGSVALRKIFQTETDTSPVKVHTHTVPLDDHDRYFNAGGYSYANF